MRFSVTAYGLRHMTALDAPLSVTGLDMGHITILGVFNDLGAPSWGIGRAFHT